MSRFSAIGFRISSEEDLERVASAALDRAAPPTDLGDAAERYLWFRDASGGALAVCLDADGMIACITPFFAAPDGGTRWRVRTSAPHVDRGCLHCSGADCDVLDAATGAMCTRTTVQLLFFEPYQRWLEQERTFDMAVVGFASSLALCATPEDLERAQAARFGDVEPNAPRSPGNPFRLADEALLPHGMFGPEGDVGARAAAILTGRVDSVRVLANGLDGGRFVHARVHTLGGPLDVVAPADEVALPERATLAIGDCWLVGRPVDPPRGGA